MDTVTSSDNNTHSEKQAECTRTSLTQANTDTDDIETAENSQDYMEMIDSIMETMDRYYINVHRYPLSMSEKSVVCFN